MTPNPTYAIANRPWRWMLALDGAIVAFLFLYKLFFHSPQIEYLHLLATYHFGFAKRALIGTVVSWFAEVVPEWYVYAIGLTAWIAALVLFIAAFRKIFGLNERNFPLFVYLIGSPFFFKNFMVSIGYFDIYGCILALIALIVPAGALYLPAITAGCIILILIHPIHFLLYVPTIGFIALVRYGLAPGLSAWKIVGGAAAVALLFAVFVAAAFYGAMPVPMPEFLAYVDGRATHPISAQTAQIWYSTIDEEIAATWSIMGRNCARLPVYALLIGVHYPVAIYFGSLIRALTAKAQRIVVIASLAAITLGYLAIFAVVFDYSRWVSNWSVCMFLALHAVRLLPSTLTATQTPVAPNTKQSLVPAWIATAIPRVGITVPF